MPLSEIAFELGYSELSAFSRAFRSWVGVTPQNYRSSYRHFLQA
jgi:AraC-like DNA-binding protein